MDDRIREGTQLIVVNSSGVQLFSMDLSDRIMDDYDSQRDIGRSISEGLPEEAYSGESVNVYRIEFYGKDTITERGKYEDLVARYPDAFEITKLD